MYKGTTMLRRSTAIASITAAIAVASCGTDDLIFPGAGGADVGNVGGGVAQGGSDMGGTGPGQGGTPASCGNGSIDGREVCDGDDLGGVTCSDVGYANPTGLGCTTRCELDESGCTASCDGGLLEPGEDCDGDDFGDASCTDFGFSSEAGLSCDNCQIDSSGCMATCDGALKEQGEECDGFDLGTASCTDFGYSNPNGISCDGCTLDASGCAASCDGVLLEPGETCDGSDLNGADCTDYGYVTAAGVICNSSCDYDVSGCMPVCGNMTVEPGEECDDNNADPTDGCDNCQQGGDSCANAVSVALSLGTVMYNGTTVGGGFHSTTQCQGEFNSPDRVYAVTPQQEGFLTAWLPRSNTSYDSILYVLADCNDANTSIVCADQWGNGTPNGAEVVSFRAKGGVTYTVVGDGYDQAAGTYELQLDLSAGTCADPVPYPVWSGAFSNPAVGSTSGIANSTDASCGSSVVADDVVYEIQPQFTGDIEFFSPMAAADFDLVLTAEQSCGNPAMTLDCDHDNTGDEFISVSATSGQPFYTIVDGFNGASGSYELSISP